MSISKGDFIEKAKKVHGDKYDYSKVEYVNKRTKVCIVCPKHGEFWQTPYVHLSGHNCKKCSCEEAWDKQKITTEQFIERARVIHGDKYDYTKSEYKGATIPVKIICPIHGEFWQRPSSHINNKQGCPQCSHQSYPSTKEEFVEKAKQIYGEKYNYSKVEYKNNKTKVIITCPKHGDFSMRPDNFLHNHGCPKCGAEQRSQSSRWSTEKFIEESKKIYGERFSYEETKYEKYNEKVIITCPKHGNFSITPSNFLAGHNCPHCSNSMMENRIRELLDESNIKYIQQKTFDWLKFIGPLKLDFFLPDYNIAIECQGIQHFKPVELFGGEEQLKYQEKMDNIKKELCELHNIKVLYFSDVKDKTPKFVIKNKEKLLNEIYEKNNNHS